MIGLGSLDGTYGKLSDREEVFWRIILTDVYGFSLAVADICYAHKERMITEALYSYSRLCHPPTGFYEIVAMFQKMTYDNLATLGQLTVDPMIDVFLALLPLQMNQQTSGSSRLLPQL